MKWENASLYNRSGTVCGSNSVMKGKDLDRRGGGVGEKRTETPMVQEERSEK